MPTRRNHAAAETPPAPDLPVPGLPTDIQSLYMRQMAATPLLTPEEEYALMRRARKGDAAAREQLIKANLRLVVRIAMGFPSSTLPLLDRINEGNIGLITAIDRFRLRKGAKLSTYACWWIRQRILRAISNQRGPVRIPLWANDRVKRIRATRDRLAQERGRPVSDEEVAQALGLPVGKVSTLMAASAPAVALDAPLDDEGGGMTYGDLLPDESTLSPLEQTLANDTRREINEALDRLPPRSAEILRLLFGLDGHGPRTLDEVGRRMKITRERVRQIRLVALRRLRHALYQRDRTARAIPAESDLARFVA